MAALHEHGLDNVVVASTKLSAIDGMRGQLSYSGYSIHDLAEHATFEDVCYVLWHGDVPSAAERQEFAAALRAARVLTEAEQRLLHAVPTAGHGMDALRTLASGLGQLDSEADHIDPAAVQRIGLRLTAKLPTLITGWHRRRSGKQPVAPNPELNHAANILWMLHGRLPNAVAVQALNTYMVLLAEHSLNASTFAARVAIGAGSDVYSAVTAAIATLKGVAHGGANQKAMETFLAVGTPDHAPEYIAGLLKRHERLMGVGHRIYKVEDPRVRHLRAQAHALAAGGHGEWFAVAEAVAQVVAHEPYFIERQLAPNVEFYSAPLLYTLAVPLDVFTAMFALSRVAGWVGHIGEQLADNRLIRPKAEYVGPAARNLA